MSAVVSARKGTRSSNRTVTVQRKRTRKMAVKLKRLQKKKKLKRHMINAIKDIDDRKHATSRKRALDIEDDWILDREMVAENEADDDIIPLDMIDADIDWENSAFAEKIKRIERARKEAEFDAIESKTRKFAGTLDDSIRELLPIKLGSKLIKQMRVDEEDSEVNDVEGPEQKDAGNESAVDLSELSAAELLKLRREHVEEAKSRISSLAYAFLADPQNEMQKLKELCRMCTGEGVFFLARGTVMKLATASLTEIFVDIIPGYVIRPRSEEELAQKLKKETKKLYDFEQALLRYYLKYLQHLEKYIGKLLKQSNQRNDYELPILCLKCISRIVVSAPHFNYTSNIIQLLVRIATSDFKEAKDICCTSLSELFSKDFIFRASAAAAKSIASIVNQKKGNVSPSLIATFLKLNVKEVNKTEKKQQKEKLFNKKRLLQKQRTMKSKRKFAKQLKKLEADLKEAEASESISAKLSFATETMNYVFATYFRVIKRLPTTNLLEPVLEGLSKFAHLINVEFFDDMISALASLVNQQHLRLTDSLRCIYTVFVMVSGEGTALNIDPTTFYSSMYRLLPAIAFEKQPDKFSKILLLTLKTLDLMINSRRKQVPVCRVAAYVKRLLAIAFFMPPSGAASVLLCIRSFFIAYPKLGCMLEGIDEAPFMESFKPEIDDPDSCGALSSSIIVETKIFKEHPDKMVEAIARHLCAGLPSAGPHRLLPEYCTKKPYEWYEWNHDLKLGEEEPFFVKQISVFAKKQKIQLTSKTLCSVICRWIEKSAEEKS